MRYDAGSLSRLIELGQPLKRYRPSDGSETRAKGFDMYIIDLGSPMRFDLSFGTGWARVQFIRYSPRNRDGKGSLI